MLDIPTIINNIVALLWNILIGAAVIMFIWAGILFVIAQGDPSKISQARKAVIFGIVGLVVGIAGYSAAGIIKGILGV